jgi:putative transposase
MRIRELAEVRVSYGYRRIHVQLLREGWKVNHELVYRQYRQEGLTMRTKKSGRRHVSGRNRAERPMATARNETWSMDFMSDELFNGDRIRLFTLVAPFDAAQDMLYP